MPFHPASFWQNRLTAMRACIGAYTRSCNRTLLDDGLQVWCWRRTGTLSPLPPLCHRGSRGVLKAVYHRGGWGDKGRQRTCTQGTPAAGSPAAFLRHAFGFLAPLSSSSPPSYLSCLPPPSPQQAARRPGQFGPPAISLRSASRPNMGGVPPQDTTFPAWHFSKF